MFERIEARLGVAAFLLGSVLGFLQQFPQYLVLALLQPSISLISIVAQTVNWVSIAVTYPIALVVFYLIGKRSTQNFRTGFVVLATFVGVLLGEFFGQTTILLFPKASEFHFFPFSYFQDFIPSLTFLFVAASGFALAKLSRDKLVTIVSRRKRDIGIVLIALSFFLEGSIFLSLPILRPLSEAANVAVLVATSLNGPISTVLQFLVFYFLGRRISIRGAAFRYFGFLFVGAYIGNILGAIISVALFGQSSWSSINGSYSFGDGISYQNMSPSLVLILDSFNPIRSLPFLAFFAMSVSRLGESNLAQQPLSISPDVGGTSTSSEGAIRLYQNSN